MSIENRAFVKRRILTYMCLCRMYSNCNCHSALLKNNNRSYGNVEFSKLLYVYHSMMSSNGTHDFKLILIPLSNFPYFLILLDLHRMSFDVKLILHIRVKL